MNRLVARSTTVAFVALMAGAIAVSAWAGGKSKSCHQCGCEKPVKQVFRLVKICKEVDIPSYVYTKEEVFYPDKGSVCYTGHRSDTFYNFWRSCDFSKTEDPSQRAIQHHLPQLHCSSYTVCGCTTLHGAKPTGCHSGCSIRVPGKTQHITTPILKWETVSRCKDCCEVSGKK
ncbi:MAG: hypothetical protein O3C40_26325 [Planctomycetota bacterium]|nr:hypothetical protein [Planctomycetota bacterium]